MGGLVAVLNGLIGDLQAIGGILCVLGIIVGGLMRATAFGNERRVAASNVALSCAVLGLLIVLLAPAATNVLLNGLGAPQVPVKAVPPAPGP